jgi:DNA repair protein REV1
MYRWVCFPQPQFQVFHSILILILPCRILLGITSSVEAVSCDEAFVFVKASDPHAIIHRIRQQVLQASGCVCSVGCSDAGKLIARIATRSAKPNGYCIVDSSVLPIRNFLDPLHVGVLPGVGWSTIQKLQGAGLNLCQNVRLSSVETLKSLLGPTLGVKLHRICSGADTSLIDIGTIKTSDSNSSGLKQDSIGVQMSWGVRLTSIPHLHIFFRCLAVELISRAAKAKVQGYLLTLKLWIKSDGAPEPKKHMGHGICYQLSKSGVLPQFPTDVTVNHIMPVIIACFEKCSAGIRSLTAEDIRGVGITMSRLHSVKATSLSTQHQSCHQKQAPAEMTASSYQSLIAFSVKPVPNHSKSSLSSSELSPFKRTRQPHCQVITLSAHEPAEKRQMRQPPISSSQLDLDVLAALPPDLRRQVQDDAQKVSALKRQNKEFNRRSSFDAPLVRDLRDVATCVCPDPLYNHIFSNSSKSGNSSLEEVLQMKRSIADWMSIGPPTSDDVKLVGGIIRSLVSTRCMDSLRSFLLALARCAHGVKLEHECQNVWVEWVGRAIEFAEKKFFAEHGASLCLL